MFSNVKRAIEMQFDLIFWPATIINNFAKRAKETTAHRRCNNSDVASITQWDSAHFDI